MEGRSRQEIQADIQAARDRLTASIESLVSEAHPKVVAQRSLEDAKAFAAGEFENVKSHVKDENGWRVDRLAAIGGAVAGFLLFLGTIRAIVSRSKKKRRK